MNFYAVVIKKYLGRCYVAEKEEEDSLNKIVKEITGRQVRSWPLMGKVSTGKLSVKYAILYKIGAANWSPNYHTSSVSTRLARLIYAVVTKDKLDFGAYVFE